MHEMARHFIERGKHTTAIRIQNKGMQLYALFLTFFWSWLQGVSKQHLTTLLFHFEFNKCYPKKTEMTNKKKKTP